MGSSRRQREISQGLSAIHDLFFRLQSLEAGLHALGFLGFGLRQLTRKVVKGFAMLWIELDDLSPLGHSASAISRVQTFLSEHEECIGIAGIKFCRLLQNLDGLLGISCRFVN